MMMMRRVTAMTLIKSIDIRIITIMMTRAMVILLTKNNNFDGISISIKMWLHTLAKLDTLLFKTLWPLK